MNQPALSSQWLTPTGHQVEIAATFSDGVILRSLCGTDPEQLIAQGVKLIVSLEDLETRHKPYCTTCGVYHEPQYPHSLTEQYSQHLGYAATLTDAIAHCPALIKAAALAA